MTRQHFSRSFTHIISLDEQTAGNIEEQEYQKERSNSSSTAGVDVIDHGTGGVVTSVMCFYHR